MANANLMTPLFYQDNFNVAGKKIRAVFLREVTNGTDSYRLWRRDGKPDRRRPPEELQEFRQSLEPVRFRREISPQKQQVRSEFCDSFRSLFRNGQVFARSGKVEVGGKCEPQTCRRWQTGRNPVADQIHYGATDPLHLPVGENPAPAASPFRARNRQRGVAVIPEGSVPHYSSSSAMISSGSGRTAASTPLRLPASISDPTFRFSTACPRRVR